MCELNPVLISITTLKLRIRMIGMVSIKFSRVGKIENKSSTPRKMQHKRNPPIANNNFDTS